ncbi:tRNA methyltransferase, has a role in tRNA modification [Nowakowskiella sp. JEL0407]|nr:tRNA methyltransferase, has a role in tRNA modification [Nowakowskiella sp. JEL0407]
MESGEKFEELHVHEVYDAIAKHFSSTRYKPWPVIEKFLKEQPNGSVGADVGCGNGKYLGVNPELLILGSDRFIHRKTIIAKNGQF